MRFPPTRLSEAELRLQAEVRAFLEDALPAGTFAPGLGMSAHRDPAFSRRLGERGWLGMSLPAEYGGGGRGFVDRFVVVEELLRWGAPVGYHWVADRQTGPTINRFGTEEQKRRFLPRICRGEVCFAIGMSEPDAGSDLSSLRTTGTRVDGGWLLSGTKVWTSGADQCDWLTVLARTSREQRPQAGLTQFLVDRHSEGLVVRPITFIDGTCDFAEVSLRDVLVPDDLVLGEVGAGWSQNTSELAFERGGPDRWLSTFGVVRAWLATGAARDDPAAQEVLGAALARYRTLRGLSLSVARMIDYGHLPVIEAALVKEMATRFEQDVVAAIADLYPRPVGLTSESAFERLLARAVLTGPSFTIRGGTNEILRTVVAKGLIRTASPEPPEPAPPDPPTAADPLLVEVADRIFADTCDAAALDRAEQTGWAEHAWRRAAEAGLPWLSLPAAVGGPGGTLADALAVLFIAGRRAVPLPLAETGLLAGWLLSEIGYPLPAGPVTVVPGDPRDTLVLRGCALTGRAYGVAWAERADAVVALVADERGRDSIAVCAPGGWSRAPGTNLAGEPRDALAFEGAQVQVHPAPPGVDAAALRLRGALSRIALIAGALTEASAVTQAYTAQRTQFGRPVNSFQAVQHHLVTLAQQAALARMAADQAGQAAVRGPARLEVLAAGVIAAAAAAEGARVAHQAHGAMGLTREYALQRLTRRLWSWRGEYLSTRRDAARIGLAAARAGADLLYPAITGGSSVLEPQ
jgi:alkylation response protein AidB-like acyl-CoA dehydrogenase